MIPVFITDSHPQRSHRDPAGRLTSVPSREPESTARPVDHSRESRRKGIPPLWYMGRTPCQWDGDIGVQGDKPSVEVCETEEPIGRPYLFVVSASRG